MAAQSAAAKGLLDRLQTGDVLLLRTRDAGATFNSIATMSTWSHAAVVIRVEDPSSVLWSLVARDYATSPSSTPARGQLLLFEAVPRRGVSLFPLEARLARTHRHIRRLGVRRRQGPPLNDAQRGLLESFIQVP